MKNDFAAISVLVTRPGAAGADLCALIEAQGGRALHFPVIEFAPPQDQAGFQDVIKKLGEQDWIIFNSPQAVRSAVPVMRQVWPEFPEKVQFAAVGAGTAKSLYEAGYMSALHPQNEWSSEGLLAMPEFQHVSGKKIVIVRGEGGRQVLENVLSERGAKVIPCIAYRRILPTINAAVCLKMIHQKELDVIAAGSFESVSNLMLLLGNDSWPLLKEIPLIVMSERVKKLAAESGFQTIWVSETASNNAVLDVIAAKICSPG